MLGVHTVSCPAWARYIAVKRFRILTLSVALLASLVSFIAFGLIFVLWALMGLLEASFYDAAFREVFEAINYALSQVLTNKAGSPACR